MGVIGQALICCLHLLLVSASSSFLVASCRALSSRRPQARQADQATQETERLGDEFRRFMHLVVALDSSALRRDRPHDNVLQASLNAIIRLVVSCWRCRLESKDRPTKWWKTSPCPC